MKPTMWVDEFGNKEWRLNGKYHRLDGPAIEQVSGHKEWYLNGKYYSTEEEYWLAD